LSIALPLDLSGNLLNIFCAYEDALHPRAENYLNASVGSGRFVGWMAQNGDGIGAKSTAAFASGPSY
jgi:hypothetical protein